MMENEMSNLGAMGDRVGIMLKDDRATIERRMLREITLVPDQNASASRACYRGPEEARRKVMSKLKETITSSSTTTTKFEKSNIFGAQCKHAQTSVLIIYGE
jgi:hypothetical protein